ARIPEPAPHASGVRGGGGQVPRPLGQLARRHRGRIRRRRRRLRLQLSFVTRVRFAIVVAVAALVVAGSALPARADMNTLVLRGNYYRDRNTRVVQPALEIQKELASGTQLGAHYLLDALTSASVAAGLVRAQPFTELRNEPGFLVVRRIG